MSHGLEVLTAVWGAQNPDISLYDSPAAEVLQKINLEENFHWRKTW